MREILFRGISKESGLYVYGSLVFTILSRDRKVIAYKIRTQDAFHSEIEEFVVTPESVGQFTGRLDFYKQKIFENDKVVYLGTKGVVFYNNEYSMFMVKFENGSEYSFDSISDLIKVLI